MYLASKRVAAANKQAQAQIKQAEASTRQAELGQRKLISDLFKDAVGAIRGLPNEMEMVGHTSWPCSTRPSRSPLCISNGADLTDAKNLTAAQLAEALIDASLVPKDKS